MPVSNDVVLGRGVRILFPDLVNLYGCEIGDDTVVGPFVEIQSGVRIGRRCKIQSHTFICSGVTLEDEVFVGHGVMFVNDNYPRATTDSGDLQEAGDWTMSSTRLGHGCSIGSNATILGGLRIGRRATIGAGAVVTTDVPDATVAAGVPAKVLRGL